MDKPKCRLCGARHWANESHIWEKTRVGQIGAHIVRGNAASDVAGRNADTSVGLAKNQSNRILKGVPDRGKESPVSARHGGMANRAGGEKFDRTAYQREYMRKRRAALKSKS